MNPNRTRLIGQLKHSFSIGGMLARQQFDGPGLVLLVKRLADLERLCLSGQNDFAAPRHLNLPNGWPQSSVLTRSVKFPDSYTGVLNAL